MTELDEDECVVVGEIAMWVHLISHHSIGGRYSWEYPGVRVLEKITGKRTIWLKVERLEQGILGHSAGEVVQVVAQQIYGEEEARRWHPQEADRIWGKQR